MVFHSSYCCIEHRQKSLSQSKRTMVLCSFSKSLILFSFFSIFSIGLDLPAYSQTLDQAVAARLDVNCTGLGSLFQGTDGTAALGIDIGANLNAICATPGTGAGASVGGGSGAVQSTGVSVSNSTALKRLAEARGGEIREEGVVTKTDHQGVAVSVESGRIWNSLSLFGSGNVEYLERDVTTFQNGYTSTILGLTGGADYRFNNKVLGGVAFTFQNQNGDFKNSGGAFSRNGLGGTIFASFIPTQKTFLQIVGGFIRNNHNVSRSVSYVTTLDPRTFSGRASSNSDSNEFSASILVGYDHLISKVTVGPRVGLNYSNTQILNYSEVGGTGLELVYDDQWINSLQSVLGMVVSMPLSTGIGVFLPQISADFIHEFANSQRSVTVHFAEDLRANPTRFKFLTDGPVRDFVNLTVGVSAVLPHGIQPFANFRAMVGNEQFTNYAGTFGIRVELGATKV